MSVMKCVHWHSSQVFSLDNCVDDTPIDTGLTADQTRPRPSFPCLMLSDPSLAGVEGVFLFN